MPTISFPSSPSLNDTYTFGGKTWVYDGYGWQLQSSGAINNIPIGNATPSTGAFTTLSATGNITGNYFIGNGSQLTGLPAGYSNADVANYLPSYTGALPLLTGNVTTTANVSGAYVLGNGAFLTGLPAGYSNANVANYLASNASVTIVTTGNITTTSNVAADYFIGNGSQLTGLPAPYGNANVKAYLESGNTINANFGGGNITSTGTATFGATQVNGNLNVSGNIVATGNVTYISVQDLVISDPMIYLGADNPADLQDLGIIGSYNDGTYQHTGVVRDHTDDTWKVFTGVTTEPNTVVDWSQAVYAPFKSGAITSNASILANTTITAVGNISGANVTTTGSVDALGNISGNYVLGNGAFLTGLPAGYSNANVANYLASNDNVTVLTTGNITTSANIAGDYILGNGAYLTGLPAGYSNANVFDYLGSNSNVAILTTGNITTTANVTADYFLGNGRSLTGLPGNTTVSNTAPVSPSTGDWWIQANTGVQFVYFESGGNSQWAEMEADTSIMVVGGTYGNANIADYLASNSAVTITTTGDITTSGNVTANNINGTVNVNTRKRTINYIIDGGGVLITTGSKGYVVVDANCTIESWTILLDQSGDANVDVKRTTYADFPTTASIAGSIPPAVTGAVKAQNTSLSGWGNTAIAAGDILEFVVQGTPVNATRVTVSLNLTNN